MIISDIITFITTTDKKSKNIIIHECCNFDQNYGQIQLKNMIITKSCTTVLITTTDKKLTKMTINECCYSDHN